MTNLRQPLISRTKGATVCPPVTSAGQQLRRPAPLAGKARGARRSVFPTAVFGEGFTLLDVLFSPYITDRKILTPFFLLALSVLLENDLSNLLPTTQRSQTYGNQP